MMKRDLRKGTMERETEQRFVHCFVRREKRERLLFELHGKHRREGMGRFCHCAEEMLIKEKVIESRPLNIAQIRPYVEQYAPKETCYICAYNKSLDGQRMPAPAALEKALGNGMAALLIFERLAIVETEQENGTPERYVLLDQ